MCYVGNFLRIVNYVFWEVFFGGDWVGIDGMFFCVVYSEKENFLEAFG